MLSTPLPAEFGQQLLIVEDIMHKYELYKEKEGKL